MFLLILLTIIVVVLLVSLGYTIGTVQGGIHIHKYTETNYQSPKPAKYETPPESSVNLNLNQEDYVSFAQKSNGRIDY